jgi:DNA-binding MarR family transcriptional regulator
VLCRTSRRAPPLTVYSQRLRVTSVLMQTERMTNGRRSTRSRDAHDEEADALLAACRVLVAVSAQSIAAVEDVVDLIEFRALVVVASRGAVSLSELSDAANIHLSRASRLCDRLVTKALINRADDPANRRQLILTLTPNGERVVYEVMQRRREAIQPILDRMSKRLTKQRRAEVMLLLQEFATAGGEPSDPDLWAMGWTT